MKTEKQIENLSIALLKWGFEGKPHEVVARRLEWALEHP